MKTTRDTYHPSRGLVTYDTDTSFRIFLREYDDELHTASWRFYDAYETKEQMHAAHYQLWIDNWRHNMYAPGSPDPKTAIITAADRAYHAQATQAADDAQL